MSGQARAKTVAALEAAGVVAVIRLKDAGKLRGVVDALVDGGVRALEITMTVPGAVDLIRAIAPTLPDGFLLGAGTVTDGETAARVIDAGASFVVSPVFRREVLHAAHKHDVAALPGCFTPTEILDAWDAGADIVKVFPAGNVGGPKYIKALKGPFPQIEMIPTGGVNLETAGEFLKAGACAVAVGGELVDAKTIKEGKYEVFEERARQYLAVVAKARAEIAAGA